MRKFVKAWVVLLAAVLLAMSAAGCGGNNANATTTAATSAATTAAATAATTAAATEAQNETTAAATEAAATEAATEAQKETTTAATTAATTEAQTETTAAATAAAAASGKPVWNEALGKYEPLLVVESIHSIGSSNLGEMAKVGWTADNNKWLDYYRDNLGIDVKYRWVSDDSMYKEKLQLAIASNDIPDVFSVGSTEILTQLYAAGTIQPLDEAYQVGANDYVKSFIDSTNGVAMQTVTMADGKIYAIPRVEPAYDENSYFWIRQDWLEKLGLEAPKTMDELYNIAAAFKEADLDGTGSAFGLAADKDIWYGLRGFFWGFGAYPTKWVKIADGSHAYGSNQPEMKDALSMLNKMYANGLLDVEFGIKDSGKVNEDIMAGRCGIVYGGHWVSFVIQSMIATFPDCDWFVYNLPSATGAPAIELLSVPYGGFKVVKTGFEYPEALLRLINVEATAEYENNNGGPEESKKWKGFFTDPETGAGNLFNAVPFIQHVPRTNVDAYNKLVEMKEAFDRGVAPTEENWNPANVERWEGVYNADPVVAFGYRAYFGPIPHSALAICDEQLKAGTIQFSDYNGTISADATDKMGTLNQLRDAMVIKVIVGDLSVEEGFEKYLQDWNNFGGPDVTKEVNDWFVK